MRTHTYIVLRSLSASLGGQNPRRPRFASLPPSTNNSCTHITTVFTDTRKKCHICSTPPSSAGTIKPKKIQDPVSQSVSQLPPSATPKSATNLHQGQLPCTLKRHTGRPEKGTNKCADVLLLLPPSPPPGSLLLLLLFISRRRRPTTR